MVTEKRPACTARQAHGARDLNERPPAHPAERCAGGQCPHGLERHYAIGCGNKLGELFGSGELGVLALQIGFRHPTGD